jgi:hypothetical protein
MSNGWLVEVQIPTLAEAGEVVRLYYVRAEDGAKAEEAVKKHLGVPQNAKATAMTPVLETVLDDLRVPEGGVMEMP